ncbi:hypothetical protein [Pseudogemmobacter faecipullorum]|uniref:Uncharacterized protein n=1 Tax=Pseudogemmobacter faecipullorum TaxID=2755041 RepID=A0ABS8CKP5_9RHOB|nr:hypothetical protein [Pseudogemmobacter faecipullorum]MCB5409949.1 hypothetical protein [Pseudogemmobacter faecipullorum]
MIAPSDGKSAAFIPLGCALSNNAEARQCSATQLIQIQQKLCLAQAGLVKGYAVPAGMIAKRQGFCGSVLRQINADLINQSFRAVIVRRRASGTKGNYRP